jgi:hypothetical protein
MLMMDSQEQCSSSSSTWGVADLDGMVPLQQQHQQHNKRNKHSHHQQNLMLICIITPRGSQIPHSQQQHLQLIYSWTAVARHLGLPRPLGWTAVGGPRQLKE